MQSFLKIIVQNVLVLAFSFLACQNETPTHPEPTSENFTIKMSLVGVPDDVAVIREILQRQSYDDIIRQFIIEGDSAFVDFGLVYVGVWHLSVTAFSSDGSPLYFGETYVNIRPGENNIVYLRLDSIKGGLSVIVTWGQEADTVIVIQPGPNEGKDAEVWDLSCDTEYAEYSRLCEDINEGAKPYIRAASWTYWGPPATHRSYIEFNLDGIDVNGNLIEVLLYLYSETFSGQTQSGDNELYIHRVIQSWEENNIIWLNQPEIAEQIYGQDYIIVPKSYSIFQDYAINITPIVKYWLKNPEQNFGMRTSLVNENPYGRAFWASSEFLDPNRRPKIVLKFKYHSSF